ncbi:MAG: cation:proton antiporter, partial [Caulobacterales bacterium]|nr:cation:proton antiporter [Caulobacterales bacterium]
MHNAMNITEIFLVAMVIIFAIPYLFWRIFKTDYFAPLVVVQIIGGIMLGPGVLGAIFPQYYDFVFDPKVVNALNGIAWWAVMIFVFVAGIELDLEQAWKNRKESSITAGLALGVPLIFGAIAAIILLNISNGWIGEKGTKIQFILGIGMACAVTALPILVLFLEKLEILRQPIGQRILRYASLDDIAIWGVLALILLDWTRIGRQAGFLVFFWIVAILIRKLMAKLDEKDRWYIALIWLAICGLAADWAGLHFMVGAFLAGVILEAKWFNQEKMDMFRSHVLLAFMPVFFLSTGLKTQWDIGGTIVFVAAAILSIAAISGKLIGVHIAGIILK